MAPVGPTNGWNEWSKHILAELERSSSEINEARKDIVNLNTEVKLLTQAVKRMGDVPVALSKIDGRVKAVEKAVADRQKREAAVLLSAISAVIASLFFLLRGYLTRGGP